jgi:hypothetical protein
MANNPSLAAATAAAMLAAFNNLASAGFINVYNGSQPSNSDQAITTQTELISFLFGSPAFQPASGGVIGANTIAPATAIATGTASWFRMFASDGGTAIMDGSVGTTGCDLNLATTTITNGDIVAVTGFTVSLPLT